MTEPGGPIIGSMALLGEPLDGSGPVVIVFPLLKDFVLEEGVSKSRREMLQFEAFSAACPEFQQVEVAPGDDPPDLRVKLATGVVGLELTQLSVATMRTDVAHLAEVGDLTRAALIERAADFPHLTGRQVLIALPDVPPRRAHRALVDSIVETLETDVGVMGEGMAWSAGFPQSLPMPPPGFHPRRDDGVLLQVNPGIGQSDGIEVLVSLVSGLEVPVRDAERALETLVARKDREENDVLLVSLGVPDAAGAVFPIDGYLYHALEDYELPESSWPRHLSTVYLHNWSTFAYRVIYRRKSAS